MDERTDLVDAWGVGAWGLGTYPARPLPLVDIPVEKLRVYTSYIATLHIYLCIYINKQYIPLDLVQVTRN